MAIVIWLAVLLGAVLVLSVKSLRSLETKQAVVYSRLSIAVEQAHIMAWTYDIDKHTVYLMTGESLLDAENIIFSDIPSSAVKNGHIHPDDEVVYKQLYQCISSGEASASAVVRWRFKYGDWRWIKMTYTLLPADAGKRQAFGIGIDITEQKKVEEQLAEETARYTDLEGELVSGASFDLVTNRAFYLEIEHQKHPLSGASMTEINQYFLKLIPKEYDKHEFIRQFNPDYLLQQYHSGRRSIEFCYQRENSAGCLCWVCTHINLLKDLVNGHIKGYVHTCNIDRKMTDQLVLESIVEDEIDLVAYYDVARQKVRVINRSDERESLAETPWHYIQSKHTVPDYVFMDDRELYAREMDLERIKGQLKRENPYEVVFRVQAADGADIHRKRMRIYYLDELENIIVFMRSDITSLYREEQKQHRQLQRALAKAEAASQAKGNFLSRISHEIRTPMNAIIGLSSLLADEVEAEGYVAANINKINMSAKYLLAIINDVLDMSRIENGRAALNISQIEFVDFLQDIQNIIGESTAAHNVRYKQIVLPLAAGYFGDEVKLKQIMVNILSNAVKFTPAHGEVSFSVEKSGTRDDSDRLRFIIKDTGIGIDEKFLPHIFDLFEQEYDSNTTTYGGTGLGMAITKKLVDMMQGSIVVQSQKGLGTTVTIEMELQRVEDKQADISGQQERAFDFRGRHILLAEDNEINREIAKSILQQAGFSVEAVEDGQKALTTYISRPEHTYDLILMDIRMPVMDGLEAASRIRATGKSDAKTIPIIAMTANAFEEDREKSLSAGMNEHITKPVEPRRLYSCLQQYMGDKA